MVPGMNILIVESKAKCKTLLKHLGSSDWRVLSTGGHVEELAVDRKLHPPKEVRKAYWSHQPGQLPAPPWFWSERGEAAIKAITSEAGKHEAVTFYLAADPDREGERIAWHLERLLSELGPCRRVTFQEITKPAVLAAVAAPRTVDQHLVDAALIRTFIDRAVGWRASKIARRYTSGSSNSMGRVQTPTLGFVVARELEREAHVPVRYFEVLAKTAITDWRVRFHERSDPAAWVDEKSRFSAHRTADAGLAQSAHAALAAAARLTVSEVTRRTKSQAPQPPFSTDTLLQAAGGSWSWSPKRTAVVAGKLYEAGHLTYIRTDSTRLAAEAVEAGRAAIAKAWGADQLAASATGTGATGADTPGAAAAVTPGKQAAGKPGAPAAVTTGAAAPAAGKPNAPAAGVQDAHEAIRPTQLDIATLPDVEPDEQKLYTLVRARTLASLMIPSQRVTLSLTGRCDGLDRILEGSVGWYSEPGWRRAFQADDLDERTDTTPIDVQVVTDSELLPGEAEHPNPELREDATKPPARYRAHTLIKAMKEAGIGRPSTYAKTIEKLEERGYVTTDDGSLAPTTDGRSVWLDAAPLFSLPGQREVFQTEYTAAMETLLDEVAAGRADASDAWETVLEEFKSAHATAQAASNSGLLVPRTRQRLLAYLEAAPLLQDEVGDLDVLTEKQGKALLDDFRTRGIPLLATTKQAEQIDRLMAAAGLALPEALDSADLVLAGSLPNRTEASELIDHLMSLENQAKVPSAKQLRWISDLAKKAGLDEAAACAVVQLQTYRQLTGGNGGSASALIDALKAKPNGARAVN